MAVTVNQLKQGVSHFFTGVGISFRDELPKTLEGEQSSFTDLMVRTEPELPKKGDLLLMFGQLHNGTLPRCVRLIELIDGFRPGTADDDLGLSSTSEPNHFWQEGVGGAYTIHFKVIAEISHPIVSVATSNDQLEDSKNNAADSYGDTVIATNGKPFDKTDGKESRLGDGVPFDLNQLTVQYNPPACRSLLRNVVGLLEPERVKGEAGSMFRFAVAPVNGEILDQIADLVAKAQPQAKITF
ncbi:hypothetical protein IT417_02255 [bacterium]|nr:hypothetical protein [bacterium]